jgi:hypothetical protein
MEKYRKHGKQHTDFYTVARWLNYRSEFSNSNKTFMGVLIPKGGWNSAGRLPTEWYSTFRDRLHAEKISYVVYSYNTPIAWLDTEQGWIEPDVSYSPTTAQHQSAVSVAISVLDRV